MSEIQKNDLLNREWRQAQYLASSDLVPSDYKDKPKNIMATMITARGYGIDSKQALQAFWVLKGAVYMYVNTMAALVARHEEFCGIDKEATDEYCTVRVKRIKGERMLITEETFTMKDAEKASLITGIRYNKYTKKKEEYTKENWIKYPKDMLYNRALSRALRRAFPDMLINMHSAEEMGSDLGKNEQKEKVIYSNNYKTQSDMLAATLSEDDTVIKTEVKQEIPQQEPVTVKPQTEAAAEEVVVNEEPEKISALDAIIKMMSNTLVEPLDEQQIAEINAYIEIAPQDEKETITNMAKSMGITL